MRQVGNGYGGSSAYIHPYIHPPHYILGTLAAQVAPADLLLKASSREASTQKSAWGKAWNHAITWTPVRCLQSPEELPALQPHLTAHPNTPNCPTGQKQPCRKYQQLTAPPCSPLLPLIFSDFCFLGFIWTAQDANTRYNKLSMRYSNAGHWYHKQGKQNWCQPLRKEHAHM